MLSCKQKMTDDRSSKNDSPKRKKIQWDEVVIQEHDKERGTRQYYEL